jgi:hypothetical protein
MKGCFVVWLVIVSTGLLAARGFAESAKCVVVKKEGSVLVMDCGERGESFQQGANVKIKTDRDKKDR